jgi:hypothetical protein
MSSATDDGGELATMQGIVTRKERLVVLNGSVRETTGAIRVHNNIAMSRQPTTRKRLELRLRASLQA